MEGKDKSYAHSCSHRVEQESDGEKKVETVAFTSGGVEEEDAPIHQETGSSIIEGINNGIQQIGGEASVGTSGQQQQVELHPQAEQQATASSPASAAFQLLLSYHALLQRFEELNVLRNQTILRKRETIVELREKIRVSKQAQGASNGTPLSMSSSDEETSSATFTEQKRGIGDDDDIKKTDDDTNVNRMKGACTPFGAPKNE